MNDISGSFRLPFFPFVTMHMSATMSRLTERTINAGAIRTEDVTSGAGTFLGQLPSSKLMSSPSPVGCLASEPQSPAKSTQPAQSSSNLHEGSTSADESSFDTYRKSMAERVTVAEIRRADAEDIIISVSPLHTERNELI